jgi:hypothetical protein
MHKYIKVHNFMKCGLCETPLASVAYVSPDEGIALARCNKHPGGRERPAVKWDA